MHCGIDDDIDAFNKSQGWQNSWGNFQIATDSLTIGASKTGTSGGVLLGGTTAFSSYKFQVTLDWVKGKTFSLMADYTNNKNYVVCVFDQVSINDVNIQLQQYINGHEYTLADGDTVDYAGIGEANLSAYIKVKDTQGWCSIDNHLVYNYSTTINPPFSGSIEIAAWDPSVNNSEIVVKSIDVESDL